ncbi:MAG: hypothetical protein HDKAJFGB_03972 [Anaerolineae bacterium]|nr:hypothetical protein [Anaerolineae bacterium]
MSQTFSPPQKLNCPNCGAPAPLPERGNALQCEYCGAHFFLPGADAFDAPPSAENRAYVTTLSPQYSANVRRWIKWLIIFVIVVTVVPMVCGIAASVCGALGAFVPFFAR